MGTWYEGQKPDNSTELSPQGEGCALPAPEDKNSFPALNEAEKDSAPIDWEDVLNKHEPWLRKVITARVGERAAVDDVFQEVALAAVRQKAPISDRSKAAHWLSRVAVLQSLAYRRKMGRRRKWFTQDSEDQDQRSDLEQPNALDWLMANERRELVWLAMDQLSTPDQEILLLKYTHDQSYRDIAEKLGLTVPAVQSKLHRARALLKEKLLQLNVDN